MTRGGIHKDGIVNETRWKALGLESGPRVLWFLKEVNANETSQPGNLRRWLQHCSTQGFRNNKAERIDTSKMWRTWLLVARTTWALNHLSGSRPIPSTTGGFRKEPCFKTLGDIAAINLAKTAGGANADKKHLRSLAQDPETWKRVGQEISKYSPNIVVAGNILQWFPPESGLHLPAATIKDQEDGFPVDVRDGVVWVNALHPNRPGIKTAPYVQRVWKAWQSQGRFCP